MLYLVSTPIGNLGDISDRARQVLSTVDLVACEDTRTSNHLFSLLGITVAATTSYHEHNADTVRPKLIDKLKRGVDIALVSDAGTPLISDPGYKLVRDCYDAAVPVTVVPGANAVLSALQLSGLPSDAFYFAGFLSPKQSLRQVALKKIKDVPATLILYDTPNRLMDVLNDIHEILGNRLIAVVREITKKFEEVRRSHVDDLISYYTNNGVPKGEIVIVIDRSRGVDREWTRENIQDLIRKTLETNTARDTVTLVTDMTGFSKKEIYQQVLMVQDEKNESR